MRSFEGDPDAGGADNYVCQFSPLSERQREDRMSKKLDAAINALVDALAELPEHELEG